MVTPTEDEQGNIVINDNLKMATTFNNHFATQFTQENLDRIPNPVKMFQGSSEEELNTITFEESSICNKLKRSLMHPNLLEQIRFSQLYKLMC